MRPMGLAKISSSVLFALTTSSETSGELEQWQAGSQQASACPNDASIAGRSGRLLTRLASCPRRRDNNVHIRTTHLMKSNIGTATDRACRPSYLGEACPDASADPELPSPWLHR